MKTYIDNVLEESQKNYGQYILAVLPKAEIINYLKQKLKEALDQQKEELTKKLEGEKKNLIKKAIASEEAYEAIARDIQATQAFDRAIEIIEGGR